MQIMQLNKEQPACPVVAQIELFKKFSSISIIYFAHAQTEDFFITVFRVCTLYVVFKV